MREEDGSLVEAEFLADISVLNEDDPTDEELQKIEKTVSDVCGDDEYHNSLEIKYFAAIAQNRLLNREEEFDYSRRLI